MAKRDPRITPASLFLDADGTVGEALRRLSPLPKDLGLELGDDVPLRPYPDDAIAAIRRKYGTAVYWYRRPVKELLAALMFAPEMREKTLVEALGLHETDGLKPVQLTELPTSEPVDDAVVLSGQAFVGFSGGRDEAATTPTGEFQVSSVQEDIEGQHGDDALDYLGVDEDVDPVREAAGDEGNGGDQAGAAYGDGGGAASYEPPLPTITPYPPPAGKGTPSAFSWIRDRILGTAGGSTRASAAVEDGGGQGVSGPGNEELFSAFPKIQAPSRVEPAEAFDLVIGLTTVPMEGVEGTRVTTSVPRGTRQIEFEVQVTAERFQSEQGWLQPLKVTLNDVDKSEVRFRLTAPTILESDRGTILALLLVHFTRAGLECGTAWRRMVVAPKEYQEPWHPGAPAFWVTDQPSPAVLNAPGAQFPIPDLTVRIDTLDGDPSSGKFSLTFATPHAVTLPSAPAELNVKQDAPSFAKGLIAWMDSAEGKKSLELRAPSIASVIAAKLPRVFWSVVEAVAAEVAKKTARGSQQRSMTLLLLSAEGSIPWELASMPRPLNAALPNFLGAQVAIGRWILGESGPPLPPKHKVGISRIAAISAYYSKDSRINQLPGALEEAKDMQKNWGAVALNASQDALTDLLTGRFEVDGTPIRFQAIHFACHGRVFPTDPVRNAVLLEDGSELNAIDFRTAPIGQISAPLLFLNACQVGTGSVLLGENVGFAGCSLHAGFSAFIGPLWSVNDVQARAIAHEFYEKAFSGEGVGEILRGIRSRYNPRSGSPGPTATPLAYVLYGNPGLKLTREL